jgi:glycerophosphoryl diester phosphodiesterase
MKQHEPFISAHRGNCGIPGLPLAESYERAIALGVDYVEFDVRRTKDGIYVIWHDEHTPSERHINDLSYEEYLIEQGDQALTVPQLLTITAGKVGLHVDLKETGYEDDIVQLILNSATGKLVFTSLEDATVRVIKERFPALNVGLSLGRGRLNELFPEKRLLGCHADFVAVYYLLATIGILRYCARKGMPAWVWTVDNERDMLRFLHDPRVTTLITNKPDVAMALRATQESAPVRSG